MWSYSQPIVINYIDGFMWVVVQNEGRNISFERNNISEYLDAEVMTPNELVFPWGIYGTLGGALKKPSKDPHYFRYPIKFCFLVNVFRIIYCTNELYVSIVKKVQEGTKVG